MFNKFDKKLLLPVLLSGIFYGFSFPPVNFYLLIFISFPILIIVIYNCKNLKQAIFRSYNIFFIAGLVAVSWIALSGIREGADPFLILGGLFVLAVYPLFFVLPSVIFYYIKKNLSGKNKLLSLIVFPFIWTGFEYVSSLGQISFPWLLSGNSQSYNLEKIQYADITGVFGISFWICTISVCIYNLMINLKSNSWKLSSAKSVVTIALILVIYFLPDVYNYFSDFKNRFTDQKSNGTIKVGIIQPNINPWKKWNNKQGDLINYYAENIKKIYSENPDLKLVVLPETALPYYFREDAFEYRYKIIKNVCDSLNLPLLIGTPDREVYKDQSLAPNDAKINKKTGEKYDTYNSAFLFEPGKDKDEFQKHYKVKLVIGSERMPYQELLPFTKNLIEWGVGLGSWQMGKDTNIFSLNEKFKFNTAICYESVYPEFFSEFVKRGTDFSVIITNDGWWGKLFGTYQHNQYAVFRAVENRTWIVRCANTGVSDFIDQYGNMYDKTNINEAVNIVHEIGIKGENTFYTEHGDLFSRICLITGLFIFGSSFFLRSKQKVN
ncbi:MAG TPA: apolipoprotein N-acyltransferase [Ignavibacteria bacterium]|nr:apolipoprotein N-acyltransferase [Ignavibacteria bacterium]